MSMLMKLAAGGNASVYVDDVFSTYTYTGTGAAQTITNGIDLAGKGGLVWCKTRGSTNDNALTHTLRGINKKLATNTTAAENTTYTDRLTAFNSNGFTLGADASGGEYNQSGNYYVAWTFRNAPQFYTHSVVTKSAGSNATVDLSTLGTVGMVRVKRTDSTGSWYIWHRSLTAGKLLIGETTTAEITLGHITVSGTTLTLVNGVIADGTYLVEAWAHDTSATGIIQCGSFTTDGSGNATVSLGWEPQYLMFKMTNGADDWKAFDTMRGFLAKPATANLNLLLNSSAAEGSISAVVAPNASGFEIGAINASKTFSYLAIRRPNKPPTSGTQVYNAIARTGTGAAATVTGVGFAPDLVAAHIRNGVANGVFFDRLRGGSAYILPNLTSAEASSATEITSFDMDGFSLGTDAASVINAVNTYANWCFKRAHGFFDEVCYTGTGAATTVAHGLGVAPELIIYKCRSGSGSWIVHIPALGILDTMQLETTSSAFDYSITNPTSSLFYVTGSGTGINDSAETYVAYLFATLAGISKVGSYTGNGTSQTIPCGFSAGARFFLTKATSTTGSWWVFDSTRGIVASTDFGLRLNSTGAEVTSADAVDPDASGIIVNEEATCSINTNGVTYIYLAIA